MRRLLGLLAVTSLLMTLSVLPANAVVISKFDLTSARLVQKGSAVDLTFSVGCDEVPPFSDFHTASYVVFARVDQRVGKTTVTTVPVDPEIPGNTRTCMGATTPVPVTIRLHATGAKKPKFRQRPARITASLFVFGVADAETSTLTEVIRLSKKAR